MDGSRRPPRASSRGRRLALPRGRIAALALAFALAIAAGCAPASTSRDAPAAVATEVVAEGFELPSSVRAAGGAVDLLLIVEQRGRIRALDPRTGEVQREPVLDLADEVSCCGERGLLDVAPHPDVGENGWVFVSFTAPDGALTIDRYAWASDPGAGGDVRLDPATRRNVLAVPQPGEAHNGGSLAFGPDGMLYVGAGEGRYRLFPPRDARRLDTLLGSLLRIDVDALPYRVPPDNPFVDTDGARPEIWAYGLRNPWRFSIDAATNRLFLADVGQFDTEEINVVDLGTGGGYDFGWPVMEGPVCRVGCDDGPIGTLPPLSYGHDEGCSVIGGAVYRGAALPELTGSYLFGDFCRGTLWVADEASGDWRRRPLLATGAAISSIGVGADGEIYLADYGRGRVLRLVPATTP